VVDVPVGPSREAQQVGPRRFDERREGRAGEVAVVNGGVEPEGCRWHGGEHARRAHGDVDGAGPGPGAGVRANGRKACSSPADAKSPTSLRFGPGTSSFMANSPPCPGRTRSTRERVLSPDLAPPYWSCCGRRFPPSRTRDQANRFRTH
jgi:hypothetical protein